MQKHLEKTSNLIEIDRQNIWHPFTQHLNVKDHIVIERAEGVWIYQEDGKKILDAVSSWWVNLFGHSHPVVAKAIGDQAKKMEHVIFAGFTHKPAIELSQKLLNILPDNISKIFFSDNGSTAVEVGLKMALQYWFNKGQQRKKLIAIEGSYHGDTFGAMAVGDRNPFSAPFEELMFDVQFIPFPNGENDQEVIKMFSEWVEQDDVAAFVFEPLLQGTAGMRTYSVDTLNQLMAKAKKHDVLCIADEVMTGFGRTGKYFSVQHLNVEPDIMALSKGITGGFLPLGVTVASDKIYEAFLAEDKMKTFFHGHSYTGNPICCAAAVASVDLLCSDEMQSNIARIQQRNQSFLDGLKAHPAIAKINSIGTIFSLEIKQTQETSYFNSIRDFMYEEAMSQGVLLRPLGNVIYIIPPYVISDEELNLVYDVILGILDKVQNINK